MVASATGTAGKAGGSTAPAPADDVRSGNDQRGWLLPRDRELLAAFFRTAPRRSAAHPARLSADRFAPAGGREPPVDSAGSRDVQRRSRAQGSTGGARIPHAERARQPSAHLRRV